MAWQQPKTTWGQAGQTVPGVADFNRIEENIRILGEYNRAPGYGTATGTNIKAITLSPAPSSYYEGLCFAFKNSVENTGAVTINVNGMGAKSVKKPNGNDLVSGNLKAGSVYTVRYNGTNFILQGSDAAGTATPEDVTAGKTFSNDDDTDLVGTLPILGSRSTTLIINGPGTPQVVIPSGRIDQSTIVAKIDPSKASIIKHGETLGGVTGTLKPLRFATTSSSATAGGVLQISGLDFTPMALCAYTSYNYDDIRILPTSFNPNGVSSHLYASVDRDQAQYLSTSHSFGTITITGAAIANRRFETIHIIGY